MQTEQAAGGKKPWAAWNIVERGDSKKSIWNRVGTAWHNQDGSINIKLDAVPVDGRIQIREIKEEDRARWAARKGALSTAAEETVE